MKAAIYCRVSSESQEREGTSLQTQMEECLKYCANKSYDCPAEYRFSEARSGLTLERRELERLRDLVRDKEIDIVVVYCLDRFSRDPTHGVILQEELERAGVGLEAVTETVENNDLGKLISYIRGYASKLEAEKIRDRTARGRKARARAGRIPSGSHARLYGYNYIPVGQENGGKRVINEEQSKWVRNIYHWLTGESLSTYAITLRLRALEAPTPTGKGQWQKSTVLHILTNTGYIGKTYCYTVTHTEPKYRLVADPKVKKSGLVRKPKEEWIELPGLTPPIIDEALFEAAQSQLRINRRMAERNTKRQYLLHGHVYCKRCGRLYWSGVRSETRGNRYYEYRRYRCSGRAKIVTSKRCDNVGYSATKLESLVWAEIEKLLHNPQFVLSGLERLKSESIQADFLEHELEEVTKRLRGLDREQETLLEWALKGFPEETITKENDKINRTRTNLKERKAELEKQIQDAKQAEVDLEGVEKFCELAKQNLKGFTYENKRLALQELKVEVWIDGDKIGITGSIPMGGSETNTSSSMVLSQKGIFSPNSRAIACGLGPPSTRIC